MNYKPDLTIGESNRPDLTIFVPTRGRPDKFIDFWSEFESTKAGNTVCVFVLDEDDELFYRYKAEKRDGVNFVVAPPTARGMVGALNWAFRALNDSNSLGFAVGFMGDDHRPRTHGWDIRYLEALRSLGTGFVYGNDLLQGERMPTQVAMSTDIPNALGWMCPPQFEHLCVDVIWKDLGDGIGKITYLPDVIVEHMHPLAGKAYNDRNYRQVNNILLARRDGDRYNTWHSEERLANIEVLSKLLPVGE